MLELLVLVAIAVALPAGVRSEGGPWSQPSTLAGCSGPATPAVVFPQDTPRHGTGRGAIVWGADASCRGGAGPRVSAITTGTDIPGPASALGAHAGLIYGLTGAVSAAVAPRGRVLLAAGTRAQGVPGAQGAVGARRAGSTQDTGLLLSEGRAHGPFSTPTATGGAAAPFALATAYLGDVALLSLGAPLPRSPTLAGPIELRVHRYYSASVGSFEPAVRVAAGGPVEGLAVAMDYRSDALAVWERDGVIYARDMPGSGRVSHAVVRVASAAPGAHIAALLSDDNRATLAWSETRGGITRVFAELSGTGVQFGKPRLLERFTDPDGAAPPNGSPRLVRLLSESVMLAWSGVASGHWEVHTAAVDLNGVRSINTISPPGHDALLTDLAPGPAGEAYALWSEPQMTRGGSVDYSDQALYAARGIDAYPGRTIFTAPEPIAPAGESGCTGQAAIAVDPDSDRALAAWRAPGGAIDYSLRALGGA
ncbi:MAG TPA: hypothetical protein VGI24_04415 [Solirubrobacteraceae bacterium]